MLRASCCVVKNDKGNPMYFFIINREGFSWRRHVSFICWLARCFVRGLKCLTFFVRVTLETTFVLVSETIWRSFLFKSSLLSTRYLLYFILYKWNLCLRTLHHQFRWLSLLAMATYSLSEMLCNKMRTLLNLHHTIGRLAQEIYLWNHCLRAQNLKIKLKLHSTD